MNLKDLNQLFKTRLALSIGFSSITGYLISTSHINYKTLLLLSFGGLLLTASSNAFNQIMEKDLDGMMKRTMNRPLPKGRLSIQKALSIAIVSGILGIFLLYLINLKVFALGLLSIFIYTCLYTPLKTKSPFAVLVGAFPGAFPFMLGWVAHTNSFGIEVGILFLIQFFWQFPHFWAIAWTLHEDYHKAGFKLLPFEKPNKKIAILIIVFLLITILLSISPLFRVTGDFSISLGSGIFIIIVGIITLYFSIQHLLKRTIITSKKLIFASIFYITLLQITYILDSFL